MKLMGSRMESVVSTSAKLSPAIEDYLKAIYVLRQEHSEVTTSLLANHLGFAPPSITGMVQKLAKLGLVTYEPYQGVTLTEYGQRTALEVLRHHRLLELFLVQALGYSWEEVHAEAEVLEHVISETFEARIAAQLGHPTVDPHGDPIPAVDGTLPPCSGHPLTQLRSGHSGEIVRVTAQHPEHLRYFAQLGLVPGALVTLHGQAPFDGPLTVGVGDTIHHLDSRIARTILVQQ
jgi:DtxR family transcriptional regulator, Mn-dependent transcriptional regulator